MFYRMYKVSVNRKDGSSENITVYDIDTFPLEDINPITLSSRIGGKKRVGYMLEFGTFDIETTTIPGIRDDGGEYIQEPVAFMYHWQICLGGVCLFGRKWEEFFDFIDRLVTFFNLSYDKKRLVFYVHNLSFEFQYLYSLLRARYGSFELFAVDSHKPVKVTMQNGIELRCSYKLSNMSLYYFTSSELYCPYVKAWGDLDYSIIRTAETPLTDQEKSYCLIDVLGLYWALKSLMSIERDNIISVPLTSTGYVRRIARRHCKQYPDYRKNIFNRVKLTYPIYSMLKEEARGGNTHANRWKSGRIVEDVISYDYVSSYPAVMLLYDYPMSPFSPYGQVDSLEELTSLCEAKAVIFRVIFCDLQLRPNVSMPYLPISKMIDHDGPIDADNGRVLHAFGIATYTLNEIDWMIVKEQYIWGTPIITDVYIAEKAPLPDPIRDTVKEFFSVKCELKAERKKNEGVDIDKYNQLEYLYDKSKNKLNGVFGMMFQDPVMPETIMNELGVWTEVIGEGLSEEDLLEKYNSNPKSFLSYAWGCWVTAYARRALHDLQNCAVKNGISTCIYSDTDSVKCTIMDESKLFSLNNRIRSLAESKGSYYVYSDGRKEYMGVAECEGVYRSFITLGAKKYSYVDDKGTLHVTVSGVSRKVPPGSDMGEGARELGKIENFVPGFIFREAGGTEIYYAHKDPYYITVDGCTMLTASYAATSDSVYTLGITDEYKDLIGYC